MLTAGEWIFNGIVAPVGPPGASHFPEPARKPDMGCVGHHAERPGRRASIGRHCRGSILLAIQRL